VDQGDTLVVIEHILDVVNTAPRAGPVSDALSGLALISR
jgi:hypothetical protein